MGEWSVFESTGEGFIQETYVESASTAEEALNKANEGLGETVGFYPDTVGELTWVEDAHGNRTDF